MQYPRQAAFHYRARAMQTQQAALQQHHRPLLGIDLGMLNYTSIGNLSPAFAPSTPHYTPGPTSAPASYLEVPPNPSSFTFGTQTWGAMPSPGLPAQVYVKQEEQLYGGGYGG
ncbi:hypothetical protein LTR53_020055, partial [Teratosphaeriaceae sp. CCFEE 6253]